MTNIWRIHLRKGEVGDSVSIANYCFKNKVAAMGWVLNSKNDDIKSGKIIISSYEDYERYAINEYNKKSDFGDVRRLACEVQLGDFIWTHVDGEYYLAKIATDSKYHYNYSDEAIENDACNELTNVIWKRIGNAQVVNTSIIRKELFEQGQTFRRLINPKKNKDQFEFALKYTQDIYK